MSIAKSELILGGQKSGKSRRAELLARQWLGADPSHRAVLIATAQPWDDEMRQRIQRHQSDRAQRVPGMVTVEEPLALAQAIAQHSRPDTLIVVDCLTLWLTNCLMPMDEGVRCASGGKNAQGTGSVESAKAADAVDAVASAVAVTEAVAITEFDAQNVLLAPVEHAQAAPLLIAITQAPGPLVLVGNEIGLGVIPMGAQVRAFVDTLGKLNQDVAATCQRVTLMSAGLPLTLKHAPCDTP